MPNDTSLPTDADALRAEVLRLREIVGPDEATYQQLRVELWAARDAAFGAEMAAGELRGQVKVLEGQLVRAHRNSKWLKARLKAPLRRIKGILRGV
ncbi:MAG: hypothetical protein ACKO2C_10635 [Actinomycetes bacterium]